MLFYAVTNVLFPLGEHHPGKLIEDMYKDDLELRVREQSHLVSRMLLLLLFFFPPIDKTPPVVVVALTPCCCDLEISLPW